MKRNGWAKAAGAAYVDWLPVQAGWLAQRPPRACFPNPHTWPPSVLSAGHC